MKNVNFKLHNVVNGSDALRPVFHYMKIQDGIIWGTDAIVIFKIPFNLVFGDCPQFDGYIKGDEWKKQQFYKAVKFELVGNQLQAYDYKFKDLGKITVFNEEEMIKNAGKFPNCNFLEDGFINGAVNGIRFNAEKLYELVQAMGEEFNKVKILFNDVNKAMKVICDNGATGFIMPIKFD